MVSRLRLRGHHHHAHALATAGLDRVMPDDLLFLQPWIYRWGLLFEYSITSYWVGDHSAALHACDRLLAMPDLPHAHREQTIANRRFAKPPPASPGGPRTTESSARQPTIHTPGQ